MPRPPDEPTVGQWAVGFDRALLLWRLQSATAAIQFTETMLAEGTSRSRAERSA